MRCAVVIPAAGSGARFGGPVPKQFVSLQGQPIVALTIDRFFREQSVSDILVAVAADHLARMQEILEHNRWGRVRLVRGGDTRQQSVLNALRVAVKNGAEFVAVHDAVRPFFSIETFQATLDGARQSGAALPVLPITDTLHRVENGVVVETARRSEWYGAQTPQCFESKLLLAALEAAESEGFSGTDEAAVVARAGHRVHVVEGDLWNIKITRPEDLRIARALFEERE
jgi:2-C-methyl-D-erythritol 4-phosphate cytidylyltransferase